MRLFVALDLPWEVKEELSDLSCNIPGARWVPTDNFHLTLRFIGEAGRLQAEEIHLALATLRGRSFAFSLSGSAGSRRPGASPHCGPGSNAMRILAGCRPRSKPLWAVSGWPRTGAATPRMSRWRAWTCR